MISALARVEAVTLEARAAALASRALEAEAKQSAIDIAIACLDLTTLEGADSPGRIRALCAQALSPGRGARPVAAVCVYPSLVAIAVEALRGSGVRVAAVATGFPGGQTTLDVKLSETRAAIAAGAQEIDMVIDRGAFLAGRYEDVTMQVAAVREACGGATLKVILEAAELGSYDAIRRACDLALAGGADFLKTGTGKLAVSSTPAIALVLCNAIAQHARRTGRSVGLKVAGGIRATRAALGYIALVKESLGDAWLDPARFRIGASSLLDDLVRNR